MKNSLTKKLGPLPVWAWAIVIIGGYLVAKKLRGGSLTGSAAQDANANVADNAASPAVDPGTGIGSGAGGGGTFVIPSSPQVTGGPPPVAQQGDYTGLLTTAIDSLGGGQAILGSSLDNAVTGLTETNAALVDSVTQTQSKLIDKYHMPIVVKVPTDKTGARTAAPHHTVKAETPPKGLRKSAAPPPSHKAVAASEKPHPQASDAVRSPVHSVSHGQGSKPAGHSPALHAGGGGHMLEV